jgi:hypothetical protein
VQVTDRWIRPTGLGMFYADSIAALLASRRFRTNGDDQPFDVIIGENDNRYAHM